MVDHGHPINTILARNLYDGLTDQPRANQLITIADGIIKDIQPVGAKEPVPSGTIEAKVVAPGFIDIQINGAADTQFNEEPSVEAIGRIAAGARKGGTAHIMPTFITAPGSDYAKAIAAANKALETRVPGVLGVHLEGPFLSPERPGIHPREFIRKLEQSDVDAIKQANGSVLLTLAPECQDHGLIRQLVASGVCVFIGHSNAKKADVGRAIEAGVSGVTHLFNAQSQVAARNPGVVGCALMRPELFAGIIADGLHVDPQNLAMVAKLMPERLCLVTDAMKTLAGTLNSFDLYGTTITLDDGRLTGPDGTLAGAHLAMDKAVRNAIELMKMAPAQALRMASLNPAKALGVSSELGTIQPGYRASFTLLDDTFHATETVVDGEAFLAHQRQP
ncbi:MAG: N-acetylglucosamine-6-phosphate deacetylase [Pseudomonadota bacterium]